MDVTNPAADDQTTMWNGVAGHAWVEAQGLLDRLFMPFEQLLVGAVSATPRACVLDVGCGTGGTTLAVARRLEAPVRCTGIDLSEPMIVAARARADREEVPARFICADAQSHAFEPAAFDVIVSRFGVMFFDDPIAAFANLRRAARKDARLRFVSWRSAAENPFMTTAERAAAPFLPNLAPRRTDAPGQFAFADAQRVSAILGESGWTEVDVSPIDVNCSLSEQELVRYLTRLGPVGRALQHADDRTRAKVVDAARHACDPYVHESVVRFTAACWITSATNR